MCMPEPFASVDPPSVFARQLSAEREAPNIISRIMHQTEESRTRRRSADWRMTIGFQEVSSARLIRTGNCFLQTCIPCTLSPDHCPRTPHNNHEDCRCCGDQACHAWILVRAIDRKELPCDVEHGMENDRNENAPTRVVVKPGNDDAQCHSTERPPSDPVE